MESWAKLIAAFGTLLGSLAWPVAIAVTLIIYKPTVQALLSRVRRGKFWDLEFELEHVALAASGSDRLESGQVTEQQVSSAARIESQSSEIGTASLRRELDRLSIQYDRTRGAMVPSRERTHAMTRVVVQMRSLAPSLVDLIETYKSSPSPGGRLAAIAMMQMKPEAKDLDWLLERFKKDKPFVFYHAALALENAFNVADETGKGAIASVAQNALSTVRSFSGPPDRNTVEVLTRLVN